ncbi:hypothetical protein LTR10_022242 [Elasticomyces elasticus]|uniref:Uncharacterized protein n=1 Tax=Exophiala sideris TaxID=1016849 RepID=A0ABR0JSE7_9EURO|nr:hypothetical protein LTR10_022242 [Elasticomyces elasticus]KAK5040454.1 hypothetical protein LTS07_000952 [Exophiala sideris]KAK5043120.1 hypothetical protein LTR13_000891 [Exophiala sideris]KAK5068832.1 hypothetical protein LTR69_000953 [Exophiala sideris]KAK5186429.1 hypothetical protein LTR44_001485 [Eurotiomycetes sp. CCFEE 6388]
MSFVHVMTITYVLNDDGNGHAAATAGSSADTTKLEEPSLFNEYHQDGNDDPASVSPSATIAQTSHGDPRLLTWYGPNWYRRNDNTAPVPSGPSTQTFQEGQRPFHSEDLLQNDAPMADTPATPTSQGEQTSVAEGHESSDDVPRRRWPAQRHKYAEERAFYIWYHRIDLGLTWDEVVAAYRRYWRDRRRKGGLQCKFYRLLEQYGGSSASPDLRTSASATSGTSPKFGSSRFTSIIIVVSIVGIFSICGAFALFTLIIFASILLL